jgi:hypothetical protein
MKNAFAVLPLMGFLQVESIMPEEFPTLENHLESWTKLNELLVLDTFSVSVLKKLLIVELVTKQRKLILSKLRSRIMTKESQHIKTLIHNALNPPPTAATLPRSAKRRRNRRRHHV